MKLKVELNHKSIKDTVEILKQQRKILADQAIPEYMESAANWIINRANEILDKADIGENVKSYIFNAWNTEWVDKYHLKIVNHSRKAVYVEFGVGIIGQTSKHPNADKTNYEYDVDSEHKFGKGMWQFSIKNRDELDIPQDAIIYNDLSNKNETIITQGTQGVWYLYNAVEDFKLQEQQRLWERIKKKYWG